MLYFVFIFFSHSVWCVFEANITVGNVETVVIEVLGDNNLLPIGGRQKVVSHPLTIGGGTVPHPTGRGGFHSLFL